MTGPGALALTGLVLLFAAVVAAVTATECWTYRETARPVAVAAFSLACLCWIVACWLEAIR